MRILLLIGLALCLSPRARAADGLPVGSWRQVDVTCSNPDYVMVEDEQRYRDEVRAGRIFDRYIMASPTEGAYEMHFFSVPGVGCLGTSTVTVSALPGDRLKFTFGKVQWKIQGEDPNTTVTCSDNDLPPEEYFLRLDGVAIVLSIPTGGKCGNYDFRFVRE